MRNDFKGKFEELLKFSPFRWQQRLFFDYFAKGNKGNIPSVLNIPTGLGKTSVMAIWYLALKAEAAVPRRLVYVVDRRAVVDQATTVAEEILEKSKDSELRVSTLRGQHVDNREWLEDPAAPAIVVGTVDMIGSRLLFSGYGVSRKMRPYHAGLLGADTLIVLDEAHLVPPFEKLLKAITNGGDAFGPRGDKDRKIIPSFKLLSLSATGREDGADEKRVFRLSQEDKEEDEVVKERLSAPKRLEIKVLDDRPALVSKLAERAWKLGNGPKPARVLVYCDSRDDAVKVKEEIGKKFKKEGREKESCKLVSELLVGGRRVYEREKLSKWLEQHGFLGGATEPPEQPTFLIATSAGEVGVDLDADHMVCDLVEWERMVQRLGRVNRRGKGDARVGVVAAPREKKPGGSDNKKVEKWEKDWKERLTRLRKPLDALRPVCLEDVEPDGQLRLSFVESDASSEEVLQEESLQTAGCEKPRSASPGAILELKERAKNDRNLQEAIKKATTPAPLHPALTRALVDAWSMTSLDKHTGRPDDIQPWLRGWEEDQQPQTTVVWRKYLPVRRDGSEAPKKDIEAFFEAAPPHASEKLETETYRVVDWLVERGAKAINSQVPDRVNGEDSPLRQNDVVAYALSPARDLRETLYGREIKEKDGLKEKLVGATLIVDARFGGLSDGMLCKKDSALRHVIDDGKDWLPAEDGKPTIRFRVRSVTGEEADPQTDGDWRERYRFTTAQSDEGEVQGSLVIEKWRHDAETEDDRSVGRLQTLTEHHAWTEGKARALADAIGWPDVYTDVLTTAARLHDEGKRHAIWQRAVKAPRDELYAKTDSRMNPRLLNGYRHEFGSLPYANKDGGFKALSPDLQELVLHLIVAHHGWARPNISTSGCDEPPSGLEARARDVALRFTRLQKRWGPWGLAWWEALLRAADQQASRDNDERGKRLEHDAEKDG